MGTTEQSPLTSNCGRTSRSLRECSAADAEGYAAKAADPKVVFGDGGPEQWTHEGERCASDITKRWLGGDRATGQSPPATASLKDRPSDGPREAF
jgi:hypothetical protein